MAKSDYDLYLENLARRRAPAVAEAERLLQEDRFDEAEQAIRRADDSIYGAVETAKLYRRHLEALVANHSGDRDRAETVFRRALIAAYNAYPDPHTAHEADNFEAGRAKDRAELVRILGYDPDAP
jgi:hypothetical protein